MFNCIGCDNSYPKHPDTDFRFIRYFGWDDFERGKRLSAIVAPVLEKSLRTFDVEPKTTECICMMCAKRLYDLGIPFGQPPFDTKIVRVVTRKELLRLKPFFGND